MLTQFAPPLQPKTSRVDWSNPISRGLAAAVNFAHASNPAQLFNAVNGMRPYGSLTTSWARGVGGGMIGNTYTTANTMILIPGLKGQSEITLFCLLTIAGAGTFRSAIDQDWGPGGAVRHWQFRVNNANKVEFLALNALGNTVVSSATASAAVTTAQANTGFAMAATSNPAGAAVWCDGVKTAGAAPSGTPNTSTDETGIGANFSPGGGVSTQYLNGTLYLFYAWARVLRDDEIKSVVAQPWQLLTPMRRPFIAMIEGVGGGGGGGSASYRWFLTS